MNVTPSGSRRLDTAVNCQYSMLCYVHSCKLYCNMILVRNKNCLLVSCVIYAGESGGFDGAGAAGDVVNAAGEAGDVFSHTATFCGLPVNKSLAFTHYHCLIACSSPRFL